MIYTRGLKTRDLQAILEYTYHGEMIICQGIVYEFTLKIDCTSFMQHLEIER